MKGLLRLFDHVLHQPPDASIFRCDTMVSKGIKKGQRRPKITWKRVIRKAYNLLKSMQTYQKIGHIGRKKFMQVIPISWEYT